MITGLIAVIGLLIGSFLNVVIYRLPRGKSIVRPRSYCPACEEKLKVKDLIPVISFLLTKGHCRYCGAEISYRYPAVELLTSLLFTAGYLKFGLQGHLLVYLTLFSLLIVASLVDLSRQIIPNQITYSGIIIGLIYSLLFNHINFIPALLGLLAGGGSLLLIVLLTGGMGMGDVKLAALLGAFLGIKNTILGIFVAAVLGSIVGLGLMVVKDENLKSKLPFGPLLATGCILMLFWGGEIIRLYMELIG